MKSSCASIAALLLAALPAWAQETPDAGTVDLAAEVAELKRRVAILGEELENQRTGSAPATASPETIRALGMGPAASKVYTRDGLSVGGYGELIFTAFNDRLQNGTRQPVDAFGDTERAVFYFGYKFTDWVVFNSEMEFEHSGFSDEHPEGEAIIEFAYLDFLIKPWLNIRAGQVLLPVGFINELHEPPVFLGALRPALERTLIPTTWHELGVGLHGELPGGLVYRVYFLNGLDAARFNNDGSGSISGGRQDGHQVIANRPAVSGRLDWHALPGALLGGSFYVGDSAQAIGSQPVLTTLLEAHAEYRNSGFQARALYAHLTNGSAGIQAFGADPASAAFSTGTLQSGVYVEAGYDLFTLLPALRQNLIPFARFEWMNTQQEVATGAAADPANERTTVALGVNYRPIPQVAVKADFDFNLDAAHTGRNQFNLGLGYLF